MARITEAELQQLIERINSKNKVKGDVKKTRKSVMPKIENKPKKSKPKHNESKLQRECVNWFRMQYPNKLLFAIPNGGKRNKFEAKIMKMEGVTAGVADLCLLFGDEKYNAYYFELKVGKNKQTEAQIEFEKYCNANKYCYLLIRTLDEFMEKINKILKN